MRNIIAATIVLAVSTFALLMGAQYGVHTTNHSTEAYVYGRVLGELRAHEDAADKAYYGSSSEIAEWALEELICTYNRNSEIWNKFTTRLDFQENSMLTHIRLFKVYSKLNNEEKAKEHLLKAIDLSGGKNADELIATVDKLDNEHNEK